MLSQKIYTFATSCLKMLRGGDKLIKMQPTEKNNFLNGMHSLPPTASA